MAKVTCTKCGETINSEDAASKSANYTAIFWGSILGGVFGSGIGIAGFGTAIAGTIPLAILGGFLGSVFGGVWYTCRTCVTFGR